MRTGADKWVGVRRIACCAPGTGGPWLFGLAMVFGGHKGSPRDGAGDKGIKSGHVHRIIEAARHEPEEGCRRYGPAADGTNPCGPLRAVDDGWMQRVDASGG